VYDDLAAIDVAVIMWRGDGDDGGDDAVAVMWKLICVCGHSGSGVSGGGSGGGGGGSGVCVVCVLCV
jgi:hypothetical protein